MNTQLMNTPTTMTPVRAPYMVVNPGETWIDAANRHRRETGHRGSVIIVAINRGTRPACH